MTLEIWTSDRSTYILPVAANYLFNWKLLKCTAYRNMSGRALQMSLITWSFFVVVLSKHTNDQNLPWPNLKLIPDYVFVNCVRMWMCFKEMSIRKFQSLLTKGVNWLQLLTTSETKYCETLRLKIRVFYVRKNLKTLKIGTIRWHRWLSKQLFLLVNPRIPSRWYILQKL